MSVATEAGKAAELICFALQPKVARGADDRYGELWTQYRIDDEFHDVVDAVANGLGLVVIDATEQALIVAPMEKSPFSFRLRDYSTGLDPRRRILIGLVHLGIAAVAYPRESDLEDDIVVRRSPEQVENLLRQACAALADAEKQDPSAEDTAEQKVAWHEYQNMPSAKKMQKGGYSIDCTLGLITRAFEWLVEQGMARPVPDGYQLLDRYRVQVREVAGHPTLDRLRAITSERIGTEASVLMSINGNGNDDGTDPETGKEEC